MVHALASLFESDLQSPASSSMSSKKKKGKKMEAVKADTNWSFDRESWDGEETSESGFRGGGCQG